MLAHKFIESLKAGPKEFIVANNPGPKSAMKSSPCIYEIKPLHIDVLHKALDLNKQFGMEKHFSAAWILHDLGWGYYKKGKYKTALKYAEKSLDLRKEMYKHCVNHYEIAHSLYSLGDINLALGEKIKGLDLYQHALIMYETLSLQHLPEFTEIREKINQLTKNST